jgi:hypothetical protein
MVVASIERKMFFSEEKNQKTFVSQQAEAYRPWPGSVRQRRRKSLLVLFFRKEHLAYAIVGITKLAPAFTPGVQRCVTVFVRV